LFDHGFCRRFGKRGDAIEMYLLAGLGNPGPQYSGTRHNVGFMLLDYLARETGAGFAESKWKAMTAKTVISGATVIMLKPETYMNLSGIAVSQAAHFYKVEPAKIIVLHDDLDIELGRIKMVSGGGDGGHKGVRSIIEHLGTSDFPRIKIGIGRPAGPVPPDKYVLANFGPEELTAVNQKMPAVLEGVKILLQDGISAAMNAVNQKS
jgi:PTH1 family peptidyl-tRNA hydrolase